ncbi:uncharacterized protein VTP21DRAFT_1056 [Calcarisporiella thermophila]|uniref:uncharacterized protein n=1 Tax=Calcarisporiella thermophila TaxID=911321 RepID=UPI003742A5EC
MLSSIRPSHSLHRYRIPFIAFRRLYNTQELTPTSLSSPPPPPPLLPRHPSPSHAPPNVAHKPSSAKPPASNVARPTYRLSPMNIPTAPEFGLNQNIPVDEAFKQQLRDIVLHFKAPIRYAFAYGSGVFRQVGYDGKKQPMLDFMFAVSHPEHWHAINMQQHKSHYSSVRLFGSKAVSILQDWMGAHVYFNPYVKVNGMMIKYGVVSIDRLCSDLIDWETLFLAGRLHKPIKILRDDARVRLANQVNLTSAIRVALLMLPERFTAEELFMTIAGLSYHGDFRMRLGEGPNKVRNIVSAQLDNFHRLYSPIIEDLPNLTMARGGILQQDGNPRVRSLMLQKLPRVLLSHVKERHRLHLQSLGKSWSEEEPGAMQALAAEPLLKKHLMDAIEAIASAPTLSQSFKGVLTAGPVRASRYAYDKVNTWWGS